MALLNLNLILMVLFVIANRILSISGSYISPYVGFGYNPIVSPFYGYGLSNALGFGFDYLGYYGKPWYGGYGIGYPFSNGYGLGYGMGFGYGIGFPAMNLGFGHGGVGYGAGYGIGYGAQLGAGVGPGVGGYGFFNKKDVVYDMDNNLGISGTGPFGLDGYRSKARSTERMDVVPSTPPSTPLLINLNERSIRSGQNNKPSSINNIVNKPIPYSTSLNNLAEKNQNL